MVLSYVVLAYHEKNIKVDEQVFFFKLCVVAASGQFDLHELMNSYCTEDQHPRGSHIFNLVTLNTELGE